MLPNTVGALLDGSAASADERLVDVAAAKVPDAQLFLESAVWFDDGARALGE
jgi:hypothetical protein